MRAVHTFVVVAEQRSFRKAAELLIIDPSTAGKLVRALEQEVGAQLLIRTTRQVQGLTPAGEVVLERGRRLLAQTAMLLAEVEQCRHARPDVAPRSEAIGA